MEGLAADFHGIVPAHRDFVARGAQVGRVLLGSAFAVHVGKGHRLGEHILGVADVCVGGDVQAVLEEAEVETGVIGDDGLPREVAGNRGRHRGPLCSIGSVEGVRQLAEGDGIEIVVIADLLVAEGTVAQTELGLVPGVADRSPERFLADAPACGNGGEETPAVILRES